MPSIEVSIDIDAPVAHVWSIVEPIEDHVEWMADAEAIRFVTERTRGVGTRFDCDTKIGPIRLTDRMEITEWDPPRTMGVRHEGIVTGAGRFTLAELGADRARFAWAEDLDFPWYLGGPVGAWLARPVLRAIWRRNLSRLKTIAERAG